MYISLSKGVDDPANKNKWGVYGPIIGPVSIGIYNGIIKIVNSDYEFDFFKIIDNMVFLDGMYYTEIDIIDDHDSILRSTFMRERIISFEEFKILNNGKN